MSETERQIRLMWDEEIKAFNYLAKAIVWLAQRVLSAKEYAEFAEEFNKGPWEDQVDE